MEVPEGVAVPSLDQWGMPVWFPDPFVYFPKNVVVMYAIRNPSDGWAFTTTGQMLPAPAGVWFIYTDGSGYGMVSDDYFTGGTPDLSGGTVYPPEEIRDIPPDPPPWVEDGTHPWDPPPTPEEPEDPEETPEEPQEPAEEPQDPEEPPQEPEVPEEPQEPAEGSETPEETNP